MYVQIPNLRIEAVMFGLNASVTELDNFRSNFLPLYEDDDAYPCRWAGQSAWQLPVRSCALVIVIAVRELC